MGWLRLRPWQRVAVATYLCIGLLMGAWYWAHARVADSVGSWLIRLGMWSVVWPVLLVLNLLFPDD